MSIKVMGLEIKNPWNLTADLNSLARSADTLSGQNSDFDFLRCVLNEVRMYFELNPDDQ